MVVHLNSACVWSELVWGPLGITFLRQTNVIMAAHSVCSPRQKLTSVLTDAGPVTLHVLMSSFHSVCPCSNITDMRKTYKDAFLKKHNIKLGFMSAFVKAAAYALVDQPAVNGGTVST